MHMLSAINRQRSPRNKIRIIRSQKPHPARNILRPPKAAHRNAPDDLLQHIARHRAHHVRIDIARRDRVHRNAEARALSCAKALVKP